jgi:hypothetical protein
MASHSDELLENASRSMASMTGLRAVDPVSNHQLWLVDVDLLLVTADVHIVLSQQAVG